MVGLLVCHSEKLDWYQRVENNGWRLVSDRIISNAMNDPITWATANKKIDFHHVKVRYTLITIYMVN